MVYALFVGTAAFLVAVIAGKPVVDFLARRGLGKQISAHGPALKRHTRTRTCISPNSGPAPMAVLTVT